VLQFYVSINNKQWTGKCGLGPVWYERSDVGDKSIASFIIIDAVDGVL
jgi:hypothetical protein